MRILKPNVGEEFVPIFKQHIYVCAKDTKQKLILKEIKLGPAHHSWEWISLRSDHMVNLECASSGRYCSFDNAINRSVNDMYSTVYEFDDHEEMISNWDNIKYVDNITTVYKSEKELL